MNVKRIFVGIFFFVASLIVMIISFYGMTALEKGQKLIQNMFGSQFGPRFDERQMKIMGYVLPVFAFVLSLIVMSLSLYMIYKGIFLQ